MQDIVDAHHHLWDRGRFRYSWLPQAPAIDHDYLLKDYESVTAGSGVVQSVHVQADVDEPWALQETNWLLSMADAPGPVTAVVGWAPVERASELETFLEKQGDNPRLKGFRRLIQGESDDGFAARDEFVSGVRQLGEAGFSFDLCIYHHQLPAVIELARQVPDTPLVLDHIGKPDIKAGLLDPWREQIRELATMDHVCCKLSGMATEADFGSWTLADLRPFAETVIEAFGYSRLMFGSDWPVATQAVDYQRWLDTVAELTSGASVGERDALMRGTATRFYRLQ
ncbi:MAG: amidohydrolase family protein [Candidatus Latescibacteria bacterium]|nr:amidohydrolase family protein [Candidatus Latescibacterota bacterium]HJP32730.1 amidohydrolase family protein [Candidatus Latescibacterota bacterium]